MFSLKFIELLCAGDDEKSDVRESSRRRSRRSYEMQEQGPDLPLDNAAWQEILEQVMRHKDAWPFIRPVTKSEVCLICRLIQLF